jgi:hypothetical protein
MPFSTPTRFNLAAVTLTLVMGLAGFAQASTAQAHHAHARSVTAKHRTIRHASVHNASLRYTRHHRGSVRRHPVSLGQRTMDSQRAVEIQQALIQAHYLDGSPTGQWDPETQAAMVKYQTDNGWQTKITPDSRALIKLGLGPKQDDGEYSANPSGVSKLPDTAPADPIRSMATSEMPAVSEN